MSAQWFALGSDGIVYALGDCGDIEAAESIAPDVMPEDVSAIWLLDERTAREWHSAIGQFLDMQA